MRIELIQEDGKTVGWNIIAENEDDKLILGSMRQVEFWGTGDNAIQYDGMNRDPEDDRYVVSLHYATRAYQQKKTDDLMHEVFDPIKEEDYPMTDEEEPE